MSEFVLKSWTPAVPRAAVAILLAGMLSLATLRAGEFQPDSGEHICLIGNALGERMQHHNYWETLLYQRYPDRELVVRNLCHPGDEVDYRLRSLDFGSPDEHLTHSKASMVLCFFGYNESFNGEAGLDSFRRALTEMVNHTKEQSYDGNGLPQMVLVSPIAFENTGDPNLPDGSEHNERLAAYTDVMRQVAEKTGVHFVDLFAPTKNLFEQSDQRLTLNGCHLNDAGYQALAPILLARLFGEAPPQTLDQELREAVADKNFHWWHRYRAVNGYSIWGKRGAAGSDGTYNNTDVMEREREILDQMTANRDARIRQLAQGEPVPATVDDSNTLPFITPKTNVGLPDDPNAKTGKLGSLKYYSPEEQKELFVLADGFEINLFASEKDFPDLVNPVALNFDSKGRLWVSTMESYPQWKPKTPQDDKVLIFEDTNGDGRADESKVFADGLHQPTGFEIGRGGAYIANQQDILFIRDADGDDYGETRIRQLVGFDTADSHHGLAAFEWGPGGGLYCQEGTFKQSQIESPYGLSRLGDGGVWRYDPRTEQFGVHVSLAFANPWGHVFDRWGQNFVSDASPGFNYWAPPITGLVFHPDKHPGGTRDRNLDFGGPLVEAEFPTFIEKRIRPSAGSEIVSSRHFPDELQGNFLLTNVIGDRAVLQHAVREDGSGFVGEEVDPLLYCKDGNFRPVDLQFGPDGALYIVDWHNALIGHLQHNLRDPNRDKSHGRIWRLTYKNRPLLDPPKIAGEPVPALLDLLKSPEARTRYRARRELAERDTDEVVAALDQWLAGLDSADEDALHHRLEGLWIYQTHNRPNRELLGELLQADDHRCRAAAARVLFYWRDQLDDTLQLLRACLNDEHPRVRLQAVVSASYLPPDQVQEMVLDVLNYEMDPYLEYALDETMRVLDQRVTGAPLAAGS